MRLSDEGCEVMLSAKFQAAAKANGIQHREPQMEWSILSLKGEDCN
ncbi:MAG: hypothetical protein ACYCR2_10940 [Thermoplasmataceae archaeon]